MEYRTHPNLPTIRYMERLVRDFLPAAATRRHGPPDRRALLVILPDTTVYLFETVAALVAFIRMAIVEEGE